MSGFCTQPLSGFSDSGAAIPLVGSGCLPESIPHRFGGLTMGPRNPNSMPKGLLDGDEEGGELSIKVNQSFAKRFEVINIS